ncbi:class I SAM-dependent methyltransferase [Pseudonocardia sp. DR1-2]|uniref:class I SAM-dependent methyltransferase n=1 Tax=Pseudonocardia sp. DR1-2 TaxID=2951168 RepID=UPI00204329D2|nr:class I SAM-dependent methyltransferase [Pseudonocardia sp. DR1-2]MCM3845778.1 class I SAM-dependent methyltransferase [Pseudonocardia sp. DR1-2]
MTTHAHTPALVSSRLLPGYDTVARLGGAVPMYWRLLAQAGIGPRDRVLEIGCGTGNVLLRATEAVPTATVRGVDPDPEAVAMARRKAAEAGVELELQVGVAEDLPLDDGSVDRVLSSLMLHHIAADARVAALREAHRVLAPGGSLHLVDLDHDPRTGGRMRTVNRMLSLLARLDPAHRRSRHGARRDHGGHGPGGHGHGGHGHGAQQPVPELLAAAGFTDATVVGHGTTRMGPVTYYRAER